MRLAGYRPVEVTAGTVTPTDQPNLGTIVLFRLTPVPAGTVTAASLAIPEDARIAFEKGVAAACTGR